MIARRSPIVQMSVRAATPLALLVAAYAFFAGHNQPGGGFAAGLLLGAILVLRTVAGLPQPFRPLPTLALGGVIACLVALGPLLWGEVALDQVVVETTLPLLGKVKSGSALLFDVGVTTLVIGLILALLEGFEAEELAGPDGVDQQSEGQR